MMVISNLNTKLIEDRLGFINKAIAKLKSLAELDKVSFMSGDSPVIAESFLRRSLEAIFDVGRHIIAKTAGKGLVEYKEIPHALADIGVVSREQAERLRLMAGFRNRLVHFYHEVTDQELYQIITSNLSDLEDFVRSIKTFLEHYKRVK